MKRLIVGTLIFLLSTQLCAQSLTDIDVDDDGLIEIHNLQMLDAMRYQLDGSGYRTSTNTQKITAGCADGGCTGYELVKDLDFMDDASYTTPSNRVLWTVDDYENGEDLGWEPVGTVSEPFSATFKGNNHTLSNLMINRSATDSIGLFGVTGGSAMIVDLGLLNLHVRGDENVGGMAGINRGDITNSYATGTVASEGDRTGGLIGDNQGGDITDSHATVAVMGMVSTGGLVGQNIDNGSITTSYAMGTVTGRFVLGGLVGRNSLGVITDSYATVTVEGRVNVGGLAGRNESSIINSYATGAVIGEGDVLGGLVGRNGGSIINSYATGTVRGGSNDEVGGLVGINGGDITNSHAMGTVTGSEHVGGLVGENQRGFRQSGSIVNSYATGTVTGDLRVGGLVGTSGGEVASSYAMGAVTGSDSVGGLVGANLDNITSSYAMGAVTGSDNVGGLVGVNSSNIASSYATGVVTGSEGVGGLVGLDVHGSVTNSYWDRQASGVAISAGGTSKTTVELQSPTTATGIYREWSTAKWDFSSPLYYPFLKYAVGDTDTPACGLPRQPVCGTLLPHQFPSLLSELVVVNATLSPSFDPNTLSYDVLVPFDAANLELQTVASGASLRIYSIAADTEVLGSDSLRAAVPLKLIDDTLIGIEVVEDERRPTMYRLSVSYAIDGNTQEPPTPVVVVDGLQVVDEGTTVTLRVSSDNEYQCGADLRCEWYYRDATSHATELPDAELSADSLQLNFTVPTDYAEGAQISRQLIIVFAARNRGGLASAERELVVMKRDDGPIGVEAIAPLTLSDGILSIPEIDLADDPDGVNTDPALSYQWQRAKSGAVNLRDPDNWEDLDGATAAVYTTDALLSTQFSPYRVRIRYTDAQDYENTIYSRWIRDIDTDDDGLIELRYIEELYTLRYQLDGSAYRESIDAEKLVAGCAESNCKGYELARDLDFMDDLSYATSSNKARWTVADYEHSEDVGWEPIGRQSEPFDAIFEGNGYILSNLMINRPATDHIGLFGATGRSAMIVNLGLFDLHVQGDGNVGGLAGSNKGVITNSYAMGTVAGMGSVGGLVGWNDGSSITNSYAAGTVTGMRSVGGLVGLNDNSSITNSYAAGTVTGTENVGGLVGFNSGSITNSYATGTVAGDTQIGGLVGSHLSNASVTNSYWDRQTSGITVGSGGTSKTTAELQSPTTATGIYRGWSTTDWDFNGSSYYPLLKYAIGDINNPACGVSEQPACGKLLSDQIALLDDLVVGNGTLLPPFDPYTLIYDVLVAWDATHLELQATASGASLHIYSLVANVEVLSTDTASSVVPLNFIDSTPIGIEVVEDGRRSTVYSLSVSYAIDDNTPKPSTPVVVVDGIQTVDEGDPVTLQATLGNGAQCGADLRCEWHYRDATSHAVKLLDAELSADSLQLNFSVPTDYTEVGQTTRQLIIVFAARNRGGLVSAERVFVVMRRDDGPIGAEAITPLTLSGGILSAPEIDLADDPDGVNTVPELSYQWQRATSDAVNLRDPDTWETIEGATATTYTLVSTQATTQAITQFSPYRVRIRYTDAQGYENTIYSQWFRDIDTDDDALIEIRDIEGLYTMRYQLDGSGYRTRADTEKITTGCAEGGCKGYELARDLDFMDDLSYATSSNKALWTVADYEQSEDVGWVPIGTRNEPFNAIFEGNGHTLSNLMINRAATDYVGLFAFVGSNAALVNLALLNVHIEGAQYVGSLVARNSDGGRITNSYATGTVSGDAWIGSLVAWNVGSVTNSYAAGAVSGDTRIGGLVAWNVGSVTNSYATGTVSGDAWIGGLVAWNVGSVTNSYATGAVSGMSNVGGLIAQNVGGRITGSYWDRQTSSVASSGSGTAKTTAELQDPITATGIYRDWSTADWNFGSQLNYPLLKYALGTGSDYAACGLSRQPVCGTLLSKQSPIRSLLEDLVVSNGSISPPFDPQLFAYDVTVAFDTTHLELHTTATGASLRIRSNVANAEVHSTETASVAIPFRLGDDAVVRIEVVKGDHNPEVYRLTVFHEVDDSVPKPSTPVVVAGSTQLIDEGATVLLRIRNNYQCSADLLCGWYYRDAASQAIELSETNLSVDSLQLTITVPTVYVVAARTTQQLVVVFTVRNSGGVVSAELPLVIMRRNNGSIDSETIAPPTLNGDILSVPKIDLADDPDGANARPELSYQWQRATSDSARWEAIDGAIGKTYNLSLSEDPQAISYRVRIRYIDAQNYENIVYSLPTGGRPRDTSLKVRLRVFLEAPL